VKSLWAIYLQYPEQPSGFRNDVKQKAIQVFIHLIAADKIKGITYEGNGPEGSFPSYVMPETPA